MRQLVDSWVEAEKTGYGNTLGDAIKALSKECGITLTHSRVAEWRKGKYTPSPKVLSHMLYRVYPWALQEVGLRASKASSTRWRTCCGRSTRRTASGISNCCRATTWGVAHGLPNFPRSTRARGQPCYQVRNRCTRSAAVGFSDQYARTREARMVGRLSRLAAKPK